MKYLKNIKTLEELKKEYRKWAMKLHPDMGGSTEDMQILNGEYEALFARVKDIHTNKEGQEYRKATDEAPQDFIKIINELLKLGGIHIEVIGCFLWVSGDTKPHKDKLKALGLKWHNKKSCWFLSPEGYRRQGNQEYSMDYIRDLYGVQYDEETSREETRYRVLKGA
ncbi:MAG: molecular chaperone DnaJ [Oscillospiraceae bacterium]|nr:molecular chaperone DnaJ [Oscillospiraceae bacterium]